MRLTLNILSLAAALLAAHALMSGWGPELLADLPVAVRGVLALIALGLGIRGYSAGHAPPVSGEAKARRPPSWLDHAAKAAALLCLHFGLLWLLGAAPPLIERIGIAAESWLRPEAAAKRIELEAEAAETGSTGNWLWHDHRSRSLAPRTNLRTDNRPEVFLRFATPRDNATIVDHPAYLSSFALSNFTDNRWSTPATPAIRIEAEVDGFVRFSSPSARAAFGLVDYEVSHAVNPTGQNVLITLQGVESAGIAPLEVYAEGFAMLPDPPDEAIGFHYPAASRPLGLADLPHDTPIEGATKAPPGLLGIPNDKRITSYLRDQARAIVGNQPTVDSLLALETWLRSAFDYSLKTTNPQNLDALENFLFAERRGHCEHFAMTGALMLRSLGIPTRIAYGWAGGTWYESAQLMVFRSREAHAWAEVWLPDYGWVVMDPTPPSDTNGALARVAPPDEPPPDPKDEWAAAGKTSDPSRIDVAAMWLLVMFGIPALGFIIMRNRLPRGFTATGGLGFPAHTPSTGYYRVWCAACPPCQPGETLRQQIRRQRPAPPFADRLIDYHYRLQYTHTLRDAARERELERAIRKWYKERQAQRYSE